MRHVQAGIEPDEAVGRRLDLLNQDLHVDRLRASHPHGRATVVAEKLEEVEKHPIEENRLPVEVGDVIELECSLLKAQRHQATPSDSATLPGVGPREMRTSPRGEQRKRSSAAVASRRFLNRLRLTSSPRASSGDGT